MNILDIHLAQPPHYFHFIVPGEPVAWERVGFHRGRSYVPPKTANAKTHVRHCFQMCFPRERWLPSSAQFGLRCFFYCLPSRNHGGEILRDDDNMLKLILDALKEDMVWKDDRLVKQLFGQVLPADVKGSRTEILIYTIPPEVWGVSTVDQRF